VDFQPGVKAQDLLVAALLALLEHPRHKPSVEAAALVAGALGLLQGGRA
jgi:hypothetical protein